MELTELNDLVERMVKEALDRRGVATLLIAGKTGVGKSTLLNAVFGENLAETGQGRPITPSARLYEKEGFPLRLIDTRGIELAAYTQTVTELIAHIRIRNEGRDPRDHVHVAWYCLSEDSRRVEDGERDLVAALARHVPVLGVITKSRADMGFRDEVLRQMPELRNVVSVRAITEELDDGPVLPPKGLDTLVDLTMEVVPEGQQTAFAAAQRVALKHQVNQSRKIIATAATAAAAVGATPIPFADAAALVPIQVGMLAGISAAFGLDLSRAFLGTIVSGGLASMGGVVGGRAIVTGLLKLVPGAGTIAGGAIAAATASTLTTAFGFAYLAALKHLREQHGDAPLSADDISRAFQDQLRRKAKESEET
ncbi:MAG: DUF697 domain-containing protein [Deltaproteobacteria bacterium]|nr:MAG: DUF697 domain-containing protein [Deltaproteobacteria bacterium]